MIMHYKHSFELFVIIFKGKSNRKFSHQKGKAASKVHVRSKHWGNRSAAVVISLYP